MGGGVECVGGGEPGRRSIGGDCAGTALVLERAMARGLAPPGAPRGDLCRASVALVHFRLVLLRYSRPRHAERENGPGDVTECPTFWTRIWAPLDGICPANHSLLAHPGVRLARFVL